MQFNIDPAMGFFIQVLILLAIALSVTLALAYIILNGYIEEKFEDIGSWFNGKFK